MNGERRPLGTDGASDLATKSAATIPDGTDTRRGGRVLRVTVRRTASARCLACAARWDGPAAMGAASSHAQGGHYVEASYAATYVYTPGRSVVAP